MKLILEPQSVFLPVDSARFREARLWRGATSGGAEVSAAVLFVVARRPEDAAALERELTEFPAPPPFSLERAAVAASFAAPLSRSGEGPGARAEAPQATGEAPQAPAEGRARPDNREPLISDNPSCAHCRVMKALFEPGPFQCVEADEALYGLAAACADILALLPSELRTAASLNFGLMAARRLAEKAEAPAAGPTPSGLGRPN
jgi:hypothetical protein